MRFFCCVISCFVSCHFVFCGIPFPVLFYAISCFVSCYLVFCFMPFHMPSRLYCSFPLPLLFIRFVEGRGAIKFRIRCIMCVLFIWFVEGKVTIHFPLFREVKSIISLLAWIAVVICRKSCDKMMQNTRLNAANCDAKWY